MLETTPFTLQRRNTFVGKFANGSGGSNLPGTFELFYHRQGRSKEEEHIDRLEASLNLDGSCGVRERVVASSTPSTSQSLEGTVHILRTVQFVTGSG